MARQSAAAMPTALPDPLLKVEHVAAWLGFSPRWVQEHRAELGGQMVGGRLRFARCDVQAYLDRGREQPAGEQPTTNEPTPIRPALEHKRAVGGVTGTVYRRGT